MIDRLGHPRQAPSVLRHPKPSEADTPFTEWLTPARNGTGTTAQPDRQDTNAASPQAAAEPTVEQQSAGAWPAIPTGIGDPMAPPVTGNAPPAAAFGPLMPTQSGPSDRSSLMDIAIRGNALSDTRIANADAVIEPVLRVELHVRLHRGALEIVSVPWHLAANSQLSQMLFNVGEAASVPFGRTADPRVAIKANAGEPSVFEALGAQSYPIDSERIGRLLGAASVRDSTPLKANTPTANVTSAGAPVASWVERLVRWVEQTGHDPEIWIRDYALDRGTASRMAETVRALSQEQGVRLERIVINARELWRATTHASPREMT